MHDPPKISVETFNIVGKCWLFVSICIHCIVFILDWLSGGFLEVPMLRQILDAAIQSFQFIFYTFLHSALTLLFPTFIFGPLGKGVCGVWAAFYRTALEGQVNKCIFSKCMKSVTRRQTLVWLKLRGNKTHTQSPLMLAKQCATAGGASGCIEEHTFAVPQS